MATDIPLGSGLVTVDLEEGRAEERQSTTTPSVMPTSESEACRRYGRTGMIFQKIVLAFSLALLIWACVQFRGTWSRSCDYMLKVWTVVSLSRLLMHTICHLLLSKAATYEEHKKWATSCSRLLYLSDLFNVCWFFYGVHPIFVLDRCNITSWRWGVAIWSLQLIFSIAPCCLLCLCLPYLIYHVLHSAEMQDAGPDPTPDEVVKQLVVRKYKDMKSKLRESPPPSASPPETARQPERRTTLDNLGISQAVAGVSQLTGLQIEDAIGPLVRMQSLSSRVDLPSASVVPASTIGRRKDSSSREPSCPICFCEYEDEDELVLMPCDERHAFHQSCITSWLLKSRLCPICRSNVVDTIENAATSDDKKKGKKRKRKTSGRCESFLCDDSTLDTQSTETPNHNTGNAV